MISPEQQPLFSSEFLADRPLVKVFFDQQKLLSSPKQWNEEMEFEAKNVRLGLIDKLGSEGWDNKLRQEEQNLANYSLYLPDKVLEAKIPERFLLVGNQLEETHILYKGAVKSAVLAQVLRMGVIDMSKLNEVFTTSGQAKIIDFFRRGVSLGKLSPVKSSPAIIPPAFFRAFEN